MPLYNIVTNSKAGRMERAILLNPFNSDFFIWLDAGMGHGESGIFPPGQLLTQHSSGANMCLRVCVFACVCVCVCVCCLLYTSPSPRDINSSRMPSSA